MTPPLIGIAANDTVWTPADRRRQASRLLICTLTALFIVAVISACSPRRNASEQRIAATWSAVETQFDRLERFELDFRIAAVSVAHGTDAEKLRFVHEALDQRSELQAGLKRELQRFSTAVSLERQSVRASYVAKVRSKLDNLKAVEQETVPTVEALGLQEYDPELRAYRSQLDRGAPEQHR